ncbi:TPA: hypothetical protein ACOEC9_000330 [Enterobacter roggenkampii]|uniref:HNH endonuclease n=2 Tax=Enterobacteriaceae TaxID=543 RepID=UPI0006580D7F|nr:hypothetical protein [Klebsiella pneumoniae]EKY3980159.1 HNH endonuclease [Enterobacter roggenkampii]EME2066844.1 HNH endonuclease [Cronobacter sakazakii]KME80399.1 hypothetical protein SM12_01078 [Klebsiella pneumoniae]HCA6600907.1 HNH endonuclease [Enterobacter roggenkampii]HEE0522284.1 HNH endonuclease [Klebsiella pneumoniae]
MIDNEFEYIDFLVNAGLLPKTAYSYGRYLTSVSNYLKININRNTISSAQEIKNIIERMSGKYYADSYVRNCGTALRKYLSFLDYELNDFRYPDELLYDNEYIEGAKKNIIVNSYERDRTARNKAIELHGLNCSACNMNFEDVYGEIGIGFIHIHHLKPLYTINEEYEVNPEHDLVPVCPNCHAMLHRFKETLSIEQLKLLIIKKRSNLNRDAVF